MENPATQSQALSTPSILRLPPHLRRRIYLYAGLLSPVDFYGLPYVFDLHGSNDRQTLGFHGLLLSCRTIYAEASALLYSANRFVIRYQAERSLEPLRNLTPSSLSRLTLLKIVLNQASCHRRDEAESFGQCADDKVQSGTVVDDTNGREGFANNDIPLDGHDQSVEALLLDWHATVACLASHITPSNLELCVVCDVGNADHNIELARRAVAPLGLLPPLKDCHIRLCRRPNDELQKIAHEAVLRARNITGQSPGASPSQQARRSFASITTNSQLLTLPREVRFQILEYTDLITPWKEVTWSRTPEYTNLIGPRWLDGPLVKKSQGYQASKIFCYPLDFRGERCLVHHGCQFSRCWETFPEPSIGCFCRRNHSAFSSTCRCWAPPKALFLVCRTLTEDARVVFYSGNRFVIHDFASDPPHAAPVGPYPYERLAASIFLRDVVPTNYLSQIRFLELVFPPYSYEGWPREGDPALRDWAKTIAWAREKLNAPGLTVRLVMNDAFDGLAGDDRVRITGQQGRDILSAYARILGPLTKLGADGLAKFYARFAWPWNWDSNWHERHWSVRETKVAQKQYELKRRAERLVMGDRYGQLYSDDALEPRNSLWVRRFTRDV